MHCGLRQQTEYTDILTDWRSAIIITVIGKIIAIIIIVSGHKMTKNDALVRSHKRRAAITLHQKAEIIKKVSKYVGLSIPANLLKIAFRSATTVMQ